MKCRGKQLYDCLFSCLHKDKMDVEDNEKICEYSFYADDFEMDFDSHEIVDTGRVKSAGKIFHLTFMHNITSLRIAASRIY